MKIYVEVIGGQYNVVNYGIFTLNYTTERGLIRRLNQLKRQHAEYWDNWQGWTYPEIYIRNNKKVPADINYSTAYQIAKNCYEPFVTGVYDMRNLEAKNEKL